MIRAIKISFLALLLSPLNFLNAQLSTRLDQYFLDWSVINPAAINSMKSSRVSTFYNRMFTGISGAPENIFASLVVPNSNKRIGFGLNFSQEKLGFGTTYAGNASYVYSLPINKSQKTILHTAATVGLLTQRFNPNAIDVVSTDDPVYLSLQQGKPVTRFDLKVSATLQTGGLLLGLSSGRLTNPRFVYNYFTYQTTLALSNLTTAFTSVKLKVSKDLTLQPVFAAHMFDFKKAQIQWGANLDLRETITLGLHSTGFGNVALQAGANIQKTVRIGYSYSMPVSFNAKLLGSGHEFYTSINIGNVKDNYPEDNDKFVLTPISNDSSFSDNQNTDIVPEPKKPERVESNSNVVKVESIKVKHDTIVISSFDEMKFLKSGYDTSKIVFKPVPHNFPADGYYVTVGVFQAESNANRMIKNMYMRSVTAYKFYYPDNNRYYVYIFRGDRPDEADQIKWQEETEIPDIWTKWILRKGK